MTIEELQGLVARSNSFYEALLEVAQAARVVVSQGSWGIIDHKTWDALREALRKLEETQ